MPTTAHKPDVTSPSAARRTRSAADEQRRGTRLLIVSAVVAALMFAGWWLVATTNTEGHHDAELLPLFTLFPLVPAVYHLFRAYFLRSRER
ncbi:MAG: hypothetical protein ACXV5Q_11965 [Frankiaceae bacterium]